MTVNPYTLNMLYQQGILPYVPPELCMPLKMGSENMQNPYLDNAIQGNLYQQYGNSADSFTNTYSGNSEIGASSQSSVASMFGSSDNIGRQSQGIKGIFGFNGTGSETGTNGAIFGNSGIGAESNIGIGSSFGGFGDFKNQVNKGINGFNNLSTPVKGLIASSLVLLSIVGMFKGRKKPKNAKKIFSLNPKNWFKKTKPEPPKKTFMQKLNPKNWCKD